MIHIDVRREWIDDSSNYYSKEDTISDVKENFDIRRYYSAEGKSVIIDNITTQVIIQSHSNPLNEGKYDKKIHMPIETVVNTGSIVEWENNKWIIVSNIDNIQAYKTASMIKCNNTFTFYDSTSTLHTIPCIISKGLISLDEQKIISTLDSEIAVQISNTSITRQIPMNNTFKIGLRNYTITDINDITIPGLLLLKMVYSEVSQETHTFVITILNGLNLSIQEDNTLQLNVNVTDNGVLLVNPTISYLSSDNLICTVNSSGLVTSVGIGSCTISASANGASEDIVIEVIAEEQSYLTLEISGSTSIIKTYTKEYLSIFKNNGLPIVKESSFWLTGIDNLPTTLAIITSQNSVNNTCEIKGNNLGSVKLWCKSTDEEIVSQDGMVIQIKSLF